MNKLVPICDAKQRNLQIATQRITPHRQRHGFVPAPQKRCPGQFPVTRRCQARSHQSRPAPRSRTGTQLARPFHRPAMARQRTPATSQIVLVVAFCVWGLLSTGCSKSSATQRTSPAKRSPSIPEEPKGRFQMVHTTEGIYRFDTATGRTWRMVSLPAEGANIIGWSLVSEDPIADAAEFHRAIGPDFKTLRLLTNAP